MSAKQEDTESSLRESILEAQVEAALQGHDLGPFEQVENGYQAVCRRWRMTTWVGEKGLRYSLLEDSCHGQEVEA